MVSPHWTHRMVCEHIEEFTLYTGSIGIFVLPSPPCCLAKSVLAMQERSCLETLWRLELGGICCARNRLCSPNGLAGPLELVAYL